MATDLVGHFGITLEAVSVGPCGSLWVTLGSHIKMLEDSPHMFGDCLHMFRTRINGNR